MKKIACILTALLMMAGSASATILPATGIDEDYYAFTGIEAMPAVILCESLTILDNRGDQGGQAVEVMRYSGSTIPVIEEWDGYAKISYADATKFGWVRSQYLLMNPAWYLCDNEMQVYAYPDNMAPRVALLDAGTRLPIITETEVDGRGWVCVSLRGAAGWIRKVPTDTANETWFRPEMLADLQLAELTWNGTGHPLTDAAKLQTLSTMLVSANDLGGPMAGCPFGAAQLTLITAEGKVIALDLATDSCCVYAVDGRHYQYARNLKTPDNGVDNKVLFDLFGVDISN